MQLAFSPRQNSRCKLSHLVIRQPGITGNGRERQTALLQQAGGNLLFGVSVAVVIALKKCIVAGLIPRVSLGRGIVRGRGGRGIRRGRGVGGVRLIKIIINFLILFTCFSCDIFI